MAIGSERITQLIHQSRPNAGRRSVTAALAAFDGFKAKRISVLTRYTEAVNQDVAATFFESQGIEGVEHRRLWTWRWHHDDVHFSNGHQTSRTTSLWPLTLTFCLSLALRCSDCIRCWIHWSAIRWPVVSSNQVLAWHSLQLMNYTLTHRGFGALLETIFSHPQIIAGSQSL